MSLSLDRGLFVLSVDGNPAKKDGRLRAGDEVIQVSRCSEVEGLGLLHGN